jgi:hypothetical protein|tara:strand:- start:1728 stop:2393 length:666 start_codon:yes stop_codon:yes gene_type:complete
MGIYHFPSEFVYWTKYEKHDEMKNKIVDRINKLETLHANNHAGLENAYTSYDTKPEPTKFLNNPKLVESLVFEPFRKMLDEYNSRENTNKITVNEVIIGDSWYTKYSEGGTFHLHSHDDLSQYMRGKRFNLAFSLIYILNDKNERNSTRFFIPTGSTTSAVCHRDITFDTGGIKNIGEGSVILFPSSLYHTVVPCIKPGRITISYNIMCAFDPEPCVKFSD